VVALAGQQRAIRAVLEISHLGSDWVTAINFYASRHRADPTILVCANGSWRCQGAPAVRAPASAHLPASGGLCREPQTAVSYQPRGTTDGAQV